MKIQGLTEGMKVGVAVVAVKCNICNELIHNGDTMVTDWRKAKTEGILLSYHRRCIEPKGYVQTHRSAD